MGGKRKELNIKKEKEEGKHQVANGERERERERETCVRQNVSALCGGLGGATYQQNFCLFNFSRTVVQVCLRCVGMKIRIFFPFIC